MSPGGFTRGWWYFKPPGCDHIQPAIPPLMFCPTTLVNYMFIPQKPRLANRHSHQCQPEHLPICVSAWLTTIARPSRYPGTNTVATIATIATCPLYLPLFITGFWNYRLRIPVTQKDFTLMRSNANINMNQIIYAPRFPIKSLSFLFQLILLSIQTL